MPTRDEVNRWQPEKLSEWATELETDTKYYETQLGQILTHFSDTTWSGAAYNAASDRFAEENDQGRRLSQEVTDVVSALRSADARLASEKRSLLGKVADAENDGSCPVPLKVADDWVVSSARTSGDTLSGEQRQTAIDKVEAHQAAINAAYHSLTGAISEISLTISTATQEIRVRGDLLGDGIDAATDAPSNATDLGTEDGKALTDYLSVHPESARDPAVLDRIASQLPTQTLTEEQLRILSQGGTVDSLPTAVQDYYRSFYQSAGSEGVLALSEHLKTSEESGNTMAAGQRDALANGLMVVSNENIGTGRNPDGTLTNPGSYQNVPSGIRDLIEAKRTDPNPIDPKQPGGPLVALQNQWQDTNDLADLIGQANPGFEPGTELATNLVLKSSDMIQDPLLQIDDDLEPSTHNFLEVAGRNHTAMTALLTGETDGGFPPLPEDYKPVEVMQPLLQYDWADSEPGQSAPNLFSWIGEQAVPSPATVDSPGVTVEQSQLAGKAATGLVDIMTAGGDGKDGGPGPFESLMNIEDKDNQSLGQVNPGLTQQITKSMLPYLDSIALAPDSKTPTFTLGDENDRDLKAVRLSTLFNSDPDSSALWNAAITDKTNEYAARFGDLSDQPSNARGGLSDAASRLLGYQDQGIKCEAYDRGLDDTEAKEEAADKKKLGLGIGTTILKDSIAGRSPVAGMGVDIVSKLIDSQIKPEDGEIPDSYYKVAADTRNAQIYYSMLQGISASNPEYFANTPPGALSLPESWIRDGRLVDYQEIVGQPGSDTTVNSTAEFSSAARAWLDGSGVKHGDFMGAESQRNIQLDDYSSSADDYKKRVLAG